MWFSGLALSGIGWARKESGTGDDDSDARVAPLKRSLDPMFIGVVAVLHLVIKNNLREQTLLRRGPFPFAWRTGDCQDAAARGGGMNPKPNSTQRRKDAKVQGGQEGWTGWQD